MNDVLLAIENYIQAAKAKAADLASRGAAALREFADWIEAQSSGIVMAAGPADAARLDACYAECQALAAPAVAGPPVVGASPWAGLLLSALTAILELLRKQKP
jgi:hypothetical protein